MFLKSVRKIRQSNRSITGKWPSLKTNSSQHFESTLERDLITLLEFDDDVERFQVQPVTIYYANTRYTPDVAVYFQPEVKRKPILYEVKYQAELLEKRDELAPRFAAANEYADANGYEFKVITEKEIRNDLLLNVKFLSRYRNGKIDAPIMKAVKTQFDTQPRNTPQQLLDKSDAAVTARMLHAIWQMLAGKLLYCDMTRQLNMNTVLWKNGRKIF